VEDFRVKRLGNVVLCAVAVLFACSFVAVAADSPAGPRLAVLIDGVEGPSTKTHEGYSSVLATIGPGGEESSILITQPLGEQPSWSADGRLLALSATGDRWPVVAVDDQERGRLRFYPRAFLNAGGDPVISPDGRTIVFQRVKVLPGRESYLFKSSIWSLDVKSGSVRRLTSWRLAASLDPSSYSPDGSTLAVESFGHGVVDGAVAIDLRSRHVSRLARNASEPTYSPDGARLAFVRLKIRRFELPKPDRPVSELWVARADGSGAKRVLRRKGFISFPSWDPSGSRLTFTRNPPGFTGSLESEPGNKVMAINADGTCLREVFSDPELTLYGSAWQPGIGREAGPINC
jgi:Tol biopolymer transport system component